MSRVAEIAFATATATGALLAGGQVEAQQPEAAAVAEFDPEVLTGQFEVDGITFALGGRAVTACRLEVDASGGTVSICDSEPSEGSGSNSGSGSSSSGGGGGSSGSSDSGSGGGGSGGGGSSGSSTSAGPSFQQRIEERCADQIGDSRLAEGLAFARGSGDHNRIILVAATCALSFGEDIDTDLGRPLSNLEQAIVDGEYSITVNDEMARLVWAYSDMAWGAGDVWADLAPKVDEGGVVSEPEVVEPVDCYFSPSKGRWLSFDQEAGVVNSYAEAGCDGEAFDFGPFAVAESAEAADGDCLAPWPLVGQLIPEAPSDWYLCGIAT